MRCRGDTLNLALSAATNQSNWTTASCKISAGGIFNLMPGATLCHPSQSMPRPRCPDPYRRTAPSRPPIARRRCRTPSPTSDRFRNPFPDHQPPPDFPPSGKSIPGTWHSLKPLADGFVNLVKMKRNLSQSKSMADFAVQEPAASTGGGRLH
jgi:hypothetical protein